MSLRPLIHVFILFVACFELQLALLELAVLDLDLLIQILHLVLQFGKTEEGDTNIFIHDSQHSDGEEGDQNAGNDRHDDGGVLRTKPEERHPLLTDLRSDPIPQKGDQPPMAIRIRNMNMPINIVYLLCNGKRVQG